MTVSKSVFECPYCSHIYEAEPPDKLHSAYSIEKPIKSSYHGTVVKKKHNCQNPDCKKTITIYWYAPLDYFNRL
jgi:hypothetical protein